jgi:hypothetical protein
MKRELVIGTFALVLAFAMLSTVVAAVPEFQAAQVTNPTTGEVNNVIGVYPTAVSSSASLTPFVHPYPEEDS